MAVRPAAGPDLAPDDDVIVVTAGAVTCKFPVPGIAEKAIGLKHVKEAVAIPDRLLTAFDRTTALPADEARDALLTVTFVGGGASFRAGGVTDRAHVRSITGEHRTINLEELTMKIVVIGGTGLIGHNVVNRLIEHGHEAVTAAPSTGVNTITGEGLKEVLQGADAVVDVSNSPSFADDDVMNFFLTSTGNITQAAVDAGVGHYVALSIVGIERSPEIGYYRAKVAQENKIKESGLPCSIVRATQFFEFAGGSADTSTVDGVVRLPDVRVQPIAAAEVSAAVARTAAGKPTNGTHEIAGPEEFRLDEWIRTVLTARNDPREVVADPTAPFFGAIPAKDALVPGPGVELAKTTLVEWLANDTQH